MDPVTAPLVEAWLAEYGWRFEAAGDDEWLTGFTGESRYFPLAIRLTPTCLAFEVRPLVAGTIDRPVSGDLAHEILDFNERLQIAKLSLAASGEIVLSCQVLTAGFGYETFTRILGILGYYADTVAPELEERVAGAFALRPALLC